MATIQKTVLKRYDGTKWDPVYLATSSDITAVGADIEVMGSEIGALKVGDTIKATDTIADTLKKILQTRIPATYTAPVVSLNVGTAAGSYEAGTTMNNIMSAVFAKNDAGDLSSLTITKNGTEVATGATSPVAYTWSDVLGDGTTSFVTTAVYGAGAIKNDNLGDPSPNGAIPAGNKTASRNYTGIRKYFYGVDHDGVLDALTASADIRGLTASSGAANKGTKFTISVPAGSTRCTIAFPTTVGTLAQVLYRESGNANITGQFNLTTAQVEGANGYTAVSYNVYTVSWPQPTAGAMTFDVTI